MKKVIMIFLLCITSISVFFGISKYLEYKNLNIESDNFSDIEKEIDSLDIEIRKKEEDYKNIQDQNTDLLEELKRWEEKVKKVESYLL